MSYYILCYHYVIYNAQIGVHQCHVPLYHDMNVVGAFQSLALIISSRDPFTAAVHDPATSCYWCAFSFGYCIHFVSGLVSL